IVIERSTSASSALARPCPLPTAAPRSRLNCSLRATATAVTPARAARTSVPLFRLARPAAIAVLPGAMGTRPGTWVAPLCCSLSAWERDTGEFNCDDRLRAMWSLAPGSRIDIDVFLAAIHPDDRSQVEAAFQQCLGATEGGDGVHETECRVIGKDDGMERWISLRARARVGPHPFIQLVGMALDITERRLADTHRR